MIRPHLCVIHYKHPKYNNMKKLLILSVVFLAFSAHAQQHPTIPSYDELKKTGYDAYQSQDYKTAYQAFHTMDSVYGITDYLDLVFYSSLTDHFKPNSEESKAMMFRIARNKCCDMKYLEEMVERQKADTLDYWDEIVAIVSPRGVQDSIYQERLLDMKRSCMAAMDLLNSSKITDSTRRVFNELKASNATELQQLIAERGFPTYTKVGYYCNDYATMLAFHLPTESLRWYLEQAKAAADTGDYNPYWIPALSDQYLRQQVPDPVYLERLQVMSDADQNARRMLDSELNNDSVWRVIHAVDSANLIELKQLINERGFPTLSNVGYKCCDLASLIAQHQPPEFLHWYLEQAKAAADTGDFDLSWIAYMTDRDLVYHGKPQLYGTQLHDQDGITALSPIEDIEHLAERRKRANLEPIEKYIASYDLTEILIHPALVNYNQYSLTCHIEGDTMRVSGTCYFSYENKYQDYLLLSSAINIDSLSMDEWQRNGDTITFAGHPVKMEFAYAFPLADFRASDGAIVLRREGNWYPHRNNELLTATVHIEAEDYYLIGGKVMTPAYELHLILLPKESYTCKEMVSPTRPFLFYRTASDTTSSTEAFYNEFIDSYGFYSSFFNDSLSQKPMNIVEIGDPEFVMCQSLRDMIIFGHYFYDVYTIMPDFSWIPHEVAHQWWGNSVFFEHRDYVLSESLDEYIKLQFLKSRERGYKEQMNHNKYAMKLAEKRLPVADIRSVEPQDASIAIYNTAPYRLEKSGHAKVDDLLQQLYQKHKNTVVSREVFLRECGALKSWLRGR